MTNDIYVKFYVNSSCFKSLIRFINNVIVDSIIMSLERINVTTLTEQDLRTTNIRVKLYVQISLSLILNVVEFNILFKI